MVTVDGNKVLFRFFRPSAARVCMIGEFNGWRDGELPMTLDREGYWSAAICLPPGNYRFRYVADGQPFADYASFGLEPGPFGCDSVVHVAKPRRRDFWAADSFLSETEANWLERLPMTAQVIDVVGVPREGDNHEEAR